MTSRDPYLILEGLEKTFGRAPVIRDLTLEVRRGEILALLGPSGSGKTTLLRLVAGFETPDRGAVRVEGQDVTRVAPDRRRFGMVFQHYALFPHMSAGENVAFGLEARGERGEAVRRRIAETLEIVDLAGFEGRRVTQLSGGQQQRVALARALAPSPRVLLLDEPLSNLDPSLRERTRRELSRLIRRVGITTVLVTHEQEEAFDLGDRIAVMHGGRLEQVGPPEEIYDSPATRFVARFVGRTSVLSGTWQGDAVQLANGVRWPAVGLPALPPGQPVDLLVRPEALTVSRGEASDALPGEVSGRRYAGAATFLLVRLDSGEEIEILDTARAAQPGERVSVALSPAGPFPRAFPPGSQEESA